MDRICLSSRNRYYIGGEYSQGWKTLTEAYCAWYTQLWVQVQIIFFIQIDPRFWERSEQVSKTQTKQVQNVFTHACGRLSWRLVRRFAFCNLAFMRFMLIEVSTSVHKNSFVRSYNLKDFLYAWLLRWTVDRIWVFSCWNLGNMGACAMHVSSQFEG